PTQPDGVAHPARDVALLAPVRVHLKNRGAHLLTLDARVTTAPDRDVNLPVAADVDGARQVPPAVLVVQTVVGEGREHFRLARGRVVPGHVPVAQKAVSQREVEPDLTARVRVEGDAVRVAEPREVGRHLLETLRGRVEPVKYVDRAALVVCEIIHIRDEDAPVWTLRHE